MTIREIWQVANDERVSLQRVLHAQNFADLDSAMNTIKSKIPCLFGYDAENTALVFQSEDQGMAALRMHYDPNTDTLALAMQTDIVLEVPQEFGDETPGLGGMSM